MSDPKRLRDPAAGSPVARELLRHARKPEAMSDAARARGAARVAKLAAVPVAATAAWLGAKGLAVAAGIGLAGVLVATAVVPALHTMKTASHAEARSPARGHHAPASRAAHAPPVETATPAETLVPAVEPAPAPASTPVVIAPPVVPHAPLRTRWEPARPSRAFASSDEPATSPGVPAHLVQASSAPAPCTGDRMTCEAWRLDEVRAMMERDPALALSRLDEYAREFPNEALPDVRELLAIDALRRLGRTAEARARAEAMIARDAGGLYVPRLRRMLEGMP